MKSNHGLFVLFLIFVSLPVGRSECRWPGAFFSEGTCFLYDNRALSYSDANHECQSKGGVLAKVTSKAQYNDVIGQVEPDTNMWIGAHYDASKGNWLWEDDNSVATELTLIWAPFQPASQKCVEIYTVTEANTRGAYSYACDNSYSFLCMEKDLKTTQDTTLVTTTDPTISSTPLTTTTDNTNTKTLMKCGANLIEFNVLLLLNLCLLKYLIF